MRILYITNHIQTAQSSGGFVNDYLNDLLFHGLTELKNIEVIDSTPIIHLYKENKKLIPIQSLWGKGFTSTYLIDKDNVDRTNIEEKIKDKYFDLIIYGSINRCLDYYNIVSEIYPPNKIFLIDGDDSTNTHTLSKVHPYFKRESISNEFIPIHFAIPECKITNNKLDKIQEYGSIIPGKDGYKFDIEQEYYNDYNKSYYGVTKKKAGWDCMRHYEILANNCIPYFIDLTECPHQTLTNLPKELLLEGRELASNFEVGKYFNILNELFEFTKNNLTTKQLAQYLLNHV
jgi:hypothetical protein